MSYHSKHIPQVPPSAAVLRQDPTADLLVLVAQTPAPQPPEEQTSCSCIVGGTLIDTPKGPIPIDELQAGDEVITRKGGTSRIHWIGETEFNASDMAARPETRPVQVPQGALGDGMPCADLLVSQRMHLHLNRSLPHQPFGPDAGPICAEALVHMGLARQLGGLRSVTYFHILLDTHDMVLANGQWVETLHPGPRGLGSLDAQHQNDLMDIFPDLFQHCRPSFSCGSATN